MARRAEKMQPVVAAELDKDDVFDGLTSRQHLFVTLSFAGLSDAEAYRQAYATGDMAYSSIAYASHQLATNPVVTAKLKELVKRRDEQATLASFLSREWITNGIAELARHADKDSTRLNAYIALGKMVGMDMFRDTVRHETVTRTLEDTERDLVAAIERAKQSLTIEGKAHQVAADTGKAKDRRRKPAK